MQTVLGWKLHLMERPKGQLFIIVIRILSGRKDAVRRTTNTSDTSEKKDRHSMIWTREKVTLLANHINSTKKETA